MQEIKEEYAIKIPILQNTYVYMYICMYIVQ